VLGADGIVGVRLEVGGYIWAPNALEFTAIGTAVKAPPGASYRTVHDKPFKVNPAFTAVPAGARTAVAVAGLPFKIWMDIATWWPRWSV
jgi:hypothetical protein